MSHSASLAALTLVTLAALAGCSADAPPVASPSPTAVEDDYQACAELADLLVPVQDMVTGIVDDPTGATLEATEVSSVADELRGMLKLTSAEMDAYAEDFASVVLILDDIYEGRADGSQTIDTGAYRDAAIAILGYCVDDVGYRAP